MGQTWARINWLQIQYYKVAEFVNDEINDDNNDDDDGKFW